MANPHVDAAFRSSKQNECYVFVKNKYVVLNYAPPSVTLVNGPLLIRDGFPMLAHTPFEHRIDCAFDTDDNEAFIFSRNLCARIEYAPHSTNPRILKGPMPIVAMFPYLRGTVFETGIDAAIKSIRKEAFLFKGDEYARIDCQSERLLANPYIRNYFGSLVGTVFENGIDAAFATHVNDEAYIFKGVYYALLDVAPDTSSGDNIVGGRIKWILSDWSPLSDLLQSEN